MISGLLILLSDKFGGTPYLTELFKQLKLQPSTPNKNDRFLRATNLFMAAKLAVNQTGHTPAEIDLFFKEKLHWTFLPKQAIKSRSLDMGI